MGAKAPQPCPEHLKGNKPMPSPPPPPPKAHTGRGMIGQTGNRPGGTPGGPWRHVVELYGGASSDPYVIPRHGISLGWVWPVVAAALGFLLGKLL